MVGGLEIGVAKDHAEQSNQQMTSAAYQSLYFIPILAALFSSSLYAPLFMLH
jgi:hypothetical protein